ncbi:oligosaccharide repeat unit polymerase [Rhodococcus aetherivorans]|uniref:Oligosaccharide repeat unit polymerase n=1 Tax=Rhodococcus aetherivorans TaxID=191292 RepID=A0AA46NWZ1_9NOCA|nr:MULTISPECIES: oligosaccharide repeat unit polymerase [Rhodococcus]USC14303.1 oligosaccharide repeat unit polymerase [Rhodococcus sp. 11-3]UYF95633.1 oligosaccharide repeat unit polymerase [Rhodococcus aetherivorans]
MPFDPPCTVGPDSKEGAPEPTVHLYFPWWLHPAVAASVLIALMLSVLWTVDDYSYALWQTPKYLTSNYLLTAACSALVFLAGIFISSGKRTKNYYELRVSACTETTLVSITKWFFGGALFGYAFWLVSAGVRGVNFGQLVAVFNLEPGAVSQVKQLSAPITGITTLTQLAPLAIALATFLVRCSVVGMRKYIVVLVALGAFRAFFYAERLALIEAVVPFALVTVVVHRASSRSRLSRFFSNWAPFLAVPGLWSIFGIFEYTRSWSFYRQTLGVSFWEFNSQRLLGYYVTAVNNSALYHGMVSDQYQSLDRSFAALWNAPLVGQLFGEPEVSGAESSMWWRMALARGGNPEYTNIGTFLVTDADLGTFLSMAYWFVLGVGIGILYSRMRKGHLVSLLMYCSSFVGILELLRIIYWTHGRFAPVLLGGVVLLIALHRVRGPEVRTRHRIRASIPVSQVANISEADR